MLKVKKIAVTGGLSAGKTTVCKIFKEFGAYVVSADQIVHRFLSLKTPIAQQVIVLLGPDIINKNKLDRKKIAAKVFDQPKLLTALEKILHSAVRNEIERKYWQISQGKKHRLFLAEIPLLFEAAMQEDFDGIVSVMADLDLCRRRFMQKTCHTAQEFDKRMTRQLSPEVKRGKAHYTIENNGTLKQLRNSVQKLYIQLTQK
jgi:dephospho-CoA kinase